MTVLQRAGIARVYCMLRVAYNMQPSATLLTSHNLPTHNTEWPLHHASVQRPLSLRQMTMLRTGHLGRELTQHLNVTWASAVWRVSWSAWLVLLAILVVGTRLVHSLWNGCVCMGGGGQCSKNCELYKEVLKICIYLFTLSEDYKIIHLDYPSSS